MAQPKSTIIGASWLLPIDQQALNATQQAGDTNSDILTDFGLLICGELIEAIAPYSTLISKYPDIEAEFYADHILLPGLINCHGHAAMSLLRGFADDYPLQQWLEKHIWPAEAKWVDEAFVTDGATLAMAEMLLSGTTTFSDMYFFPGATASAASSAGMRAQINFPVIDFANNWADSSAQHIEKGLALFDEFRHNDLVSIGFAPHSPYTVSDDTFEHVAVLANEVDARIQVHLQETAAEIEQSIADYGVTPTARLNQLGVLSPRTQAIHLTHFSTDDCNMLAESGSSVVHCPNSNAKLASGYCDITELINNGIDVGLGSDSAASSNSLNLFEIAKSASLQAKQLRSDATAVDASTALYLATLGGAKTLGIDDITGSLTLGKQADVIAVDCHIPALQPIHNPVSQLIYTGPGQAVNHVWIAGSKRVSHRQLLTIDQSALIARCKKWRDRLCA